MTRFAVFFFLLSGINSMGSAVNFQNDKIANRNQKDISSRYCIVVGSFSSRENAEKYGAALLAKGYEVTYRGNGKGFYRVCLFNFVTAGDAERRAQELLADNSFKQAWIAECKGGTDEIVPAKQLSEKTIKKESDGGTINPVSGLQTSASTSIRKKGNKLPQQNQKTYSYYCLVLGRYASAGDAKETGDTIRNSGYDVFFRKNKNDGSYLMCIYNLKTKAEAQERLDKMRHYDKIFGESWILGYDNLRENFSIDHL